MEEYKRMAAIAMERKKVEIAEPFVQAEREKHRQAMEAEQAKHRQEMDALRQAEAAKLKQQQDAARLREQQQVASHQAELAKLKQELEASRKEKEAIAREHAAIKQQAASHQAELARLKEQQEAARQAEEQARLKQEQEAAARRAEEERLKQQQEADEAARLKQEQEEAARRAEEERLKQQQEAEEAARIKQQETQLPLLDVQPPGPRQFDVVQQELPAGPEGSGIMGAAGETGSHLEWEAGARIKDDIFGDITALIRECNDEIQQTVGQAILLFGKTGSGKSTLATLMGGGKLQAILDEQEGKFVIEAMNPLKDITISSSKVAATKIPKKCYAGDIAIWDCPGFHDNRGIAQEIANGFYIKRLFETTKALKFVLVIPESALDSNRGVDFIDTVRQLIRSFTDISIIDGCASLVVTAVSQGRQSVHIVTSIQRITAQDQSLTTQVTDTISYLLKSVHILYRPSVEGPLNITYDFLTEISKTTEYARGISDYACVSISDAATEYVRHILKIAQCKFSEIATIIFQTASETHGCIPTPHNRLTDSYQDIEKLLPGSMICLSMERSLEYKENKESRGYFVDIAALSCLHDVVVGAGSTISTVNADDLLGFLNNILKAFEEHIGSGKSHQEVLKGQIQGYIYALNQQMEYIKFFGKLCGQKGLNYLSTLEQPIAFCKEAVSRNLEKAVRSIEIAKDYTDPEYYKKAIKHLGSYSKQEWSAKALAKAHMCLAELSEYPSEARSYYLKTISCDKTLPEAYSKLGDSLCRAGNYKAAIYCYKAIKQYFKIGECFKELLKLKPESVAQNMEAAIYFESIGFYKKAHKLYLKAFSFSQDEGLKAAALLNISRMMLGSQEKAAQLAAKAEAHDFHDFDSVNPAELQALMGDHGDVSVHV